jgi:ectoine hydroxylase
MKLSAHDLERYETEGYLFFERVFSASEVALLAAAVPEVVDASALPGVSHEAGSSAIRMVHGVHSRSSTIAHLARHPRLVGPAGQILRDDLYVYQSRLVVKAGLEERPFAGFPWHQDYSTWHLLDGMPQPRPVVIAVFVDDVTACNAPILVVPGSHRRGMLGQAQRDPEKYEQVVVDRDTLASLVAEGGMRALSGPPGSVLFMHCNLVHASGENISTFRRAVYYVIFNATSNVCAGGTRAEHHASLATAPLVPLDDDCLSQPEAGELVRA